jgi:hypothetical protein
VEFIGSFRTLVSSIEPSAQYVANAKAAHETVRERLRSDQEFSEAHRDTFLAGSYARHTAINDINDVDVICLVDLDHSITDPEVVLAWVQAILGKYYSVTKRQGRSVGVQAAKDVWLDIVPATAVTTDDGPLRIPDREAKQWVSAHPKGQIKAATDRNKATDGYYLQVVKLMKFWRDRLPTESSKAKSYILEGLTHGAIGLPASHASGVTNVLEGVERTYGAYRGTGLVPVIADPCNPSVNVAKRWDAGDFTRFMEQIRAAAATARSALNSTDESESRRLWRQLFGSTFGQ